MNMMHSAVALVPERQWQARLTLAFGVRGGKTALVDNTHFGPLRVQRPFYPEARDCCHVYLLHPPGGMAVGDVLHISTHLDAATNVLLTTPSAGKIYGVQGSRTVQQQLVELRVAEDACLEWLPQETIVFNGANGRLHTRLRLTANARACVWDIVCLGRPAAAEAFSQGRCDQVLEVWRDEQLLLLERNRFLGGEAMLDAPWGLKGCQTVATMVATVQPERDLVDQLLLELQGLSRDGEHYWGLTQKGELFIARYIGTSAMRARQGLQKIWCAIRGELNGSEAVEPRIWRT